MSYVFQFGIVRDHLGALIEGATATLAYSVMGGIGGLAIGTSCVFARLAAPRPIRALVNAYVEVIRNTPFLIQIFIIYFSLPAIGVRLDVEVAAVIGLSVNFGGYATEILRAGVEAVPRGQVEAGLALGLRRSQIFRRIVMAQALKIIYPALASQFVTLLLGSSVLATISASELTGITNSLQSQTFRAFEFYFVATAMYLAMAFLMRGLLAAGYRAAFLRGKAA